MVNRFKFTDVVPGVDCYHRLANAIDWLITAGLIVKIALVNSGELPLTAYTKEGYFKLLLFDVGMLGAMVHLSPRTILAYDYGTYKGYFAENFVAQELQTALQRPLYSWQENRYELEFIYETYNAAIPEVKSGSITKSKSLQKFIEKYRPPYSVIMSANNLFIDTVSKRHCYPLYLAGILETYI